MRVIIALLIITVVLTGCMPDRQDLGDNTISVSIDNSHSTITRYHDNEYNVVCWIYSGYKQGGISCIKIDD